MIIRCMHGSLLDENSRAKCNFRPKIHKCRAIPFREIALSFMKTPIGAGLNASGVVPESLIYRKFSFPAKLSYAPEPAGAIARPRIDHSSPGLRSRKTGRRTARIARWAGVSCAPALKMLPTPKRFTAIPFPHSGRQCEVFHKTLKRWRVDAHYRLCGDSERRRSAA